MRSNLTFGASWLLLILASLGACSAPPRKQPPGQELERYMTYAGEPITSFSLLGGVDNWQSLSRDKVVIWTKPNEAYLLTVQMPCSDLPFAQRIAVTSTGSTVSKGLDFVKVREQKCTIAEIRPLDYRRMQEDTRQKAAQEKP